MKKTQYIALIVLILIVGFFVLNNKKPQENLELNAEQKMATTTATSTQETSEPIKTETTNKSPILNTAGMSIPNKAWTTFQNYISFAKAHNIAGVKSLAHKFVGTCSKVESDPSMQKACFDVLDNLYAIGISLKQSDFPNSQFDSKQVILSTNPKQTDNGNTISTSKDLIYFTVNATGEIKLLGLEMGRSFSVEKGSLTNVQIQEEIANKIKDSDGDGLEDTIEKCEVKSLGTCTPTDPLKKDSDGNGYWDGVEKLL